MAKEVQVAEEVHGEEAQEEDREGEGREEEDHEGEGEGDDIGRNGEEEPGEPYLGGYGPPQQRRDPLP